MATREYLQNLVDGSGLGKVGQRLVAWARGRAGAQRRGRQVDAVDKMALSGLSKDNVGGLTDEALFRLHQGCHRLYAEAEKGQQ